MNTKQIKQMFLDDESTDEEYRDTYTLQVFCGDSVIFFCEKVFKMK